MDSDVGLFLGVYFTVLAMLILPLYIATALSSGKLFERAGEKQWKAWVPIVSAYTRTKIVFGQLPCPSLTLRGHGLLYSKSSTNVF